MCADHTLEEEQMNALEVALKAVEEHADPEWVAQAEVALRRCAEEHDYFISDDVWAYGLKEPRESRALGPVFIRARRDGLIEKTDRMRYSALRPRRASSMPVWRSLIRKV